MTAIHYTAGPEGGVSFSSERRPGEVRIPNYVYDMWLPLLGATTIGVYSVYCRLERESVVKGLKLEDIARSARISTRTLQLINETLTACKFIRVSAPKGKKRLMHWTTEITVLDPPREVSRHLIDHFKPNGDYEILTKWLMKSAESSDENPGSANGQSRNMPSENPNVLNPLSLHPSDDCISSSSEDDLSADGFQSPTAHPSALVVNLKGDKQIAAKVKAGDPLYVYGGRTFGDWIDRGWGNPYRLPSGSSKEVRKESVESFRKFVFSNQTRLTKLKDQRGKVWACFCAPLACHCDTLAELANDPVEKLDDLIAAAKTLPEPTIESVDKKYYLKSPAFPTITCDRKGDAVKLWEEIAGKPYPDQITTEIKNALAILCYQSESAWKSESSASQMGKTLREIKAMTPLANEHHIAGFREYWDRDAFRSKRPPNTWEVARFWLPYREWIKAGKPHLLEVVNGNHKVKVQDDAAVEVPKVKEEQMSAPDPREMAWMKVIRDPKFRAAQQAIRDKRVELPLHPASVSIAQEKIDAGESDSLGIRGLYRSWMKDLKPGTPIPPEHIADILTDEKWMKLWQTQS